MIRAVAQDTRSQARNRELAIERLVARLADGAARRAPAGRDAPVEGRSGARLEAKKRRGAIKRQRRARDDE